VENGGAAGRLPRSFYCRHDLPKTGRSQLPLDKPPRNEIAQCGCDAAKKPKGKSGADELPDDGRPATMRFAPWRQQFHSSRGKTDGDAIDCGAGGIPGCIVDLDPR